MSKTWRKLFAQDTFWHRMEFVGQKVDRKNNSIDSIDIDNTLPAHMQRSTKLQISRCWYY